MAKYHEIMDRVKVTDEMQSRILENVDRHFRKKERNKKLRIWLPLAGMAVAAAVLLMVMKPWTERKPEGSSTEQGTGETTGQITEVPVTAGGADNTELIIDQQPGVFREKKCSSIQELEKEIGFPVKDLKSIPFAVGQTQYRIIANDIADITYKGEGAKVIYRKAAGTDDRSGVYNQYPKSKKITVSGVTVIINGDGEKYPLSTWTDGSYAYSLYTDPGLTEDVIRSLVEESLQ